MRQRRKPHGPWRKVVDSTMREGTLTFNRQFKGRWWILTLECGHKVDRPVKYDWSGRRPSKGWARLWHNPSLTKVIEQSFKRVRCQECEECEEDILRSLGPGVD
jgi:hypothetical protein